MKILKSLMYLMVVTLLIGACNDEDPVAVNGNEVPDGMIHQNYTYTVHVVASSENGRTTGLKNATVTVSQKANVKSVKVNESGEAVFTDLTAGAVTFFVKAENFASYNYDDYLELDGDEEDLVYAGNDGEHTLELSRSTFVTLPRLGASVKGFLVADTDKNPATPEAPAAGFKVRLQYDNTIQPNLYFATVAADGSFQFTNVPEASANISSDTVLVIGGQNFFFETGTYASPRIGGLNLGTLHATSGGENISFTGTLILKPWADFDFMELTTPPVNFDQTAEVLPASAVVVVDYSDDDDYPDNLQQVFQGTRNASGVWTFTNLPTGDYTGEIKYTHNVKYAEGLGGCLVIPNNQTYSGGYPGGNACAGGSVSTYERTFTWNDFANSSDANVQLDANETDDRGAVELAR